MERRLLKFLMNVTLKKMILENLDEDDVQSYSERYLDMVHEDEIKHTSISDYCEDSLLEELKGSGCIFIKSESLTE